MRLFFYLHTRVRILKSLSFDPRTRVNIDRAALRIIITLETEAGRLALEPQFPTQSNFCTLHRTSRRLLHLADLQLGCL